jgi:hypothetical protein
MRTTWIFSLLLLAAPAFAGGKGEVSLAKAIKQGTISSASGVAKVRAPAQSFVSRSPIPMNALIAPERSVRSKSGKTQLFSLKPGLYESLGQQFRVQ